MQYIGLYIGGGNMEPGGPWLLLNFNALHRNSRGQDIKTRAECMGSASYSYSYIC